MKKAACLLLCAIAFASQPTRAATLNDCIQVANEVNKAVPMRVDQVTSIYNAACIQDGAAVTLIYRASVSVDRPLTQKDISTLRPQTVNALCTDPDVKVLLDHFVLEYSYADKNRKFIGRNRISKKDCGKSK